MSVLIVTSLGDIVVDLFTDRCPLTCKNFLKLCKMKYYNGCLFHNVQKDFTAQTGDPTGTGTGGDSIYKFLYGDQARFFGDEIHLDLKHSKTGTLAMASAGENLNASQFYFTLRDDLDYLDEKHTVFGEVAEEEGLETLVRINEAYVDQKGRPYKNIRIKHTHVLDDPFDDPSQLAELIPDASPEGKPKAEVDDEVRLEDDWVPLDEKLGPAELDELIRAKEAHSSAVVLEAIGDIPEAEVKPPENVLFVCKLNPVTQDEDLHTIFSRFGHVVSADIIRDFKTGDSLCYAFIEFEANEACEQAYFKMDNALIDDRRIHVDFSQSVSRIWNQFRRKDHLAGKGGSCFKCGALDHIAKDCSEGTMTKQPSKYVLKDDNVQRGGDDNSRYDMVFDEGTLQPSRHGKRHRELDIEDQVSRQKTNKQISAEVLKDGDNEKIDSSVRHGQHFKNRGYRAGEKNHDNNGSRFSGSRREQEHLEGRRGERLLQRRGSKDGDDHSHRDDRDRRHPNADFDRHRERYDRTTHRDFREKEKESDKSEKRDYKRKDKHDDRDRAHRRHELRDDPDHDRRQRRR